MIGVQDLRRGNVFELDGALYRVLDFEHTKIARGGATIRIRMRNLRSGATVERTFPSGTRVQDVRLDHANVQFLYHDGDLYHFMNTETFEQPALSAAVLGDAVNYLKDGVTVSLETYEGEPISVSLPTTVDLRVTEAEPGVAGDTATSATKTTTTETGLRVQVPLFVNEGDTIRVDTRDGSYITRV